MSSTPQSMKTSSSSRRSSAVELPERAHGIPVDEGEAGAAAGDAPDGGARVSWLTGDEAVGPTMVTRHVALDSFAGGLSPALPLVVLLCALLVARRLRDRLGFPDPRRAELTAQQWLRRLIPIQADRYAEHGFVEIDSTLFPGRRYRISRDRRTLIITRGGHRFRGCLTCVDDSLPPTDRVIAEYFLIQGDERGYLDTVNLFRLAPVAVPRRTRRRRLLFAKVQVAVGALILVLEAVVHCVSRNVPVPVDTLVLRFASVLVVFGLVALWRGRPPRSR